MKLLLLYSDLFEINFLNVKLKLSALFKTKFSRCEMKLFCYTEIYSK